MKLNNTIYTDEELSEELILKLIADHDTERLEVLQGYYEGNHKVIMERDDSENRPNNKLVNNYPEYIVSMFTGYSTGNPINYTSTDDKFMEDLQEIFDMNDEQDQNSEMAKDLSIKGVAYEIVYFDEDSNIRFDMLDSTEVIVVYDTKLNPNIRFALRNYTVNDEKHVVLYTDSEVIYYDNTEGDLLEVSSEQHMLGVVPIIEYVNNSDLSGDFERVLSLIDAYDKVQSDSLNDSEMFSDAYLVIEGALGTDKEDIDSMRAMKAFVLPDGSRVSYLTKTTNDTVQENIKNRLNDDIHKFSGVIDVTDENTFGGSTSGIAFKYKLLALENKVANKERKFKKGIQTRIKYITNCLNLKGANYDFTDININFNRNLPEDESVEIENAIKLKGLVSEKTALSTLSMVDNVEEELRLKEQDVDVYDLDYGEVDLEIEEVGEIED